MVVAMCESTPQRDVSFEGRVKHVEFLHRAGVNARSTRTWNDLRISKNALGFGDGGGCSPMASSRHGILDASLSMTPMSQGGPLPLNFLFRHLSGVKSTFAEAMAVAQKYPMLGTLTDCTSQTKPNDFGRRHSYLKVKHKQRKGTALRVMSSTAIVTSLMQTEEPSRGMREAKKQNKHKKWKILGSKSRQIRQELMIYQISKWSEKTSSDRQGRQSRRKTKDRWLIGAVEQKEKPIACALRRMALQKWDVQTALGQLLKFAGQGQSGGFQDLTVPKVAEFLCYCSDRSWRWRDCLVLGYDITSGMYRTISSETTSLSSQNLSGFSTQQVGTPLFGSNFERGGMSLDNSPTYRSKCPSMSWLDAESDIPLAQTRLVARLNIRLPEEHHFAASLDDGDSVWQTIPSGVQLASIIESSSTWADNLGSSCRDISLRVLQSHYGWRADDMSGCCSTQNSARLGQNFNIPSYCGTQGSVRHGGVDLETNRGFLKQIFKPLQGVESRIGVGPYSVKGESCVSPNKAFFLEKHADRNIFPGDSYRSSQISVDFSKRSFKDQSKYTKSLTYDILPLLSEIAQEFERDANVIETNSFGRAGLDYVPRGPRPIQIEGHSFLVHSMKLAGSAALLRPGLQTAMLLVVDAVRLLENTRFLAVSVPCVTIGKALALQNNTISESMEYIKRQVLGDAKDALNAALMDKRLGSMENGPDLYIRIARQQNKDPTSLIHLRWANILTEAALASALKATLNSFAARFEQSQTTPLHEFSSTPLKSRCQSTGPMFLVKLCLSADCQLVYQTPLSKLDVFSGKLLDDVVEALLSLPFMDTKDLAQSKIQRDVLLNAADEVLPTSRECVLQAITQGLQKVDAFYTTLAVQWTEFMISKCRLDAKAIEVATMCKSILSIGSHLTMDCEAFGSISRTTHQSKGGKAFNITDSHIQLIASISEIQSAVLNISQEQGRLFSVLTAAHGEVIGKLFRLDCNEMLTRTTCVVYDCKQQAARIFVDTLRAIGRQLNQWLDADEAILRARLSSITPEWFAETESVLKCYQANPHPLTKGMEVLHVCHLALDNLCLEVSDEDVHAYWSLFARAQNMLVTVSTKKKTITSARLNIMAGIRAGQSAFYKRAIELVASIAEIEVLKNPKEAFDNELLAQKMLESLQNMNAEVECLGKKEKLLDLYKNNECALILGPAISKMEHISFLWATIANWIRVREIWMHQTFHILNVDNMFVTVQSFGDRLAQLANNSSSSSASQEALFSVADEVNEVLTRLPLLLKLRHPGVRRSHWNELALKIKCDAYHEGAEGLTLRAVLDLPGLFSLQDVIWPVLERAAEEYNQEVCLEKMEEEMRMTVLELSPNSENGGRQMLHGSEVVLELLDDQLVAAGCMLHSPFAKALEGSVRAWRDKLQVMLRLLEGLLNFQKWFEILWPIFQSINIRQQLVDDFTKFVKIDVLWKEVLKTIGRRQNFMHLCEMNLIFEEVPQYVGTMEGIMCSLINLLDRKRTTFPRFFFLSNDELLQVLAHEKNPNEIQYYLCKCFCDLHSIRCSDGAVVGLWVSRTEYLPFCQPVQTQNRAVEMWMVSVEIEMNDALKHFMLERFKELKAISASNILPDKQDPGACISSSKHSHSTLPKPITPKFVSRLGREFQKDKDRDTWPPSSTVSQILIVGANAIFSSQVESALTQKGNVLKELQLQLSNITDEVAEYINEIKHCAAPESKGSCKSLILLLIYFREILSNLISHLCVALESFAWQRRLRYYWHDNGDCHVSILSLSRLYGFELINYENRLVMTALTEKCFIGLLHAFSLGLGGTVIGPAGIGKTESVKDCAKAVGKHCIAMSCSENFDYQTIGNILKGMASGGLWLCLNEVEYLQAEVVSVLSQQLLAIQHAVAIKAQRYTYNGTGLQLNKMFAICTTTKPQLIGGCDYKHNTKSSFRSVSMMMPDYCLIVEVLLTAEAIANPPIVAQKLTLCFRLATQQLSFKTNHCDFGLRAMRAVIKWVSVLNANLRNEDLDEENSSCKGDWILYEALKQYCLPRLEGEEFVLFSNLLSDLFPYLKSPSTQKKSLIMYINQSLAQHGSTPNSPVLQKCLELHGAMKVHRGVLIVGKPGTGKSQCISTLAHAINLMKDAKANSCLSSQLSQGIKLRFLNPSALTTAHVFGSNNSKTQSWHDGVMPCILQECETKCEDAAALWMILDGDMDAAWFEQASTILDDNGHLCLSNGKRILLPPIAKFSVVLEVDNLKCASPGTVSRCGIILMDTDDQSYEPLLLSWLKSCPSMQTRTYLKWLFDHFLEPSLGLAMRGPDMLLGRTGLINNFLNLLETILKLAGIWPDLSLKVWEKQPILEVSGLQGSKLKEEIDFKSDEVSAKSSIEKLGRVKQYISQRQKEVRDAVNWRRLHCNRLPIYATHNVLEEANHDQGLKSESCEMYDENKIADNVTKENLPEQLSVLETSVGGLFLFGLVWSIGGHLKVKELQENFDKNLREIAMSYSNRVGHLPSGSIYDYYYDVHVLTWKRWDLLVNQTTSLALESKETQANVSFGSGTKFNLYLERGALYIQTAETVRIELLAHILSTFGKPVLLAGVEGTGKTILGAQLLHQHAATAKCQVIGVTLNSSSHGGTLHDILRPHLTIWKRRSLMPAVNGRIVIHVDDLHIGQYHTRKEAPALQFLRFLIEQKGWYGLPMDSSFTTVDGLVHLAATNTLMGSDISPALGRLFRHYFILDSPDYNPTSLHSIFSALVVNIEPPALGYGGETLNVLNLITKASIELYSLLQHSGPSQSNGLPLLNLHDLFNVQRQLSFSDLKSITLLEKGFNLWASIFCRVVCDRLQSKVDRKVVTSALHFVSRDILKIYNDDQRRYLESLINVEEQPIFGRYFRQEDQGGEVQSWCHMGEETSRKVWERTMQSIISNYTMIREGEGFHAPIVLFPEAITHISRLLNILQLLDGHALLLGYAGSGRSTLGRLASYVLNYNLYEVQVNGNYDVDQWMADLRKLLKTCCLGEKPTEFLIILEADCIMHQQIMEDLNLIIHCGEALHLLGKVEKYYIQQELHRMEETSIVGTEQILGSNREQYLNACFKKRLRDNLHLVICAEKIAVQESSCSVACALVSRHFIVNYYDKWTSAALQTVATATLTNHQHIRNMEATDLELLTRACSIIHTVTNRYVSGSLLDGSWRLIGMPSYHEMLHVVNRFSGRKGLELGRHLKRVETGLQKLQSTRMLVESMQHNLQELLRHKDDANSNMDNLLASIAEEQTQMDKALEKVAFEEKVASEKAETCKKLAQEAQEQVQEVTPEVLIAIKQLSQLNKKDISELKSFTQPPPRLLTVLEALCIILKKEPKQIKHPRTEIVNTYWPIARELLAQVDFVKMLLSFNKDAMENTTMEKLRPYMENPLFKPEKVRQISVACRSICVWIRAMYNYHYAKTIKMEPRIERLKVANLNLDACKENLDEARCKLAIAENNLIDLRQRYNNASSTKDGLAKRADDSEVKLERAIRLIGRLDGECHRWAIQVDDLRIKAKNVIGDSVLASGIVAYLGSFTVALRSQFIAEWQKSLRAIGLPFSMKFSLVTFYTTPQDIKLWVSAGLPPDDHSLENAIIVCNSSRPLLVLDPQKQVSKWICSVEDPLNIVRVDINSSSVLDDANSCFAAGNVLIVENIGSQTSTGLFKQLASCKTIGRGETLETLDINSKHQLSSTTRVFQSRCILLIYEQGYNYLDEGNTCINLNVVDFSITYHGLCSQLLSIAAEKERVDLEEERTQLMHQRLLLNCRLQEVEDHILTLLQGVMVTILDDEALDEALSKATALYADIQAKLEKAAATEDAVELTRKRHLPVAERAAILYSCIADISQLESVYQWPFSWFKNLYSTSMQRTSALNPVDFQTRLDYLISKITIAIYRNICSGLLQKHRILFGLLLIFRLAQTKQDLGHEEWIFLLQGEAGASFGGSEKDCPCWLEPNSREWKQIQALSKYPGFRGLIQDLNRDCWREFYESSHLLMLPAPWQDKLGPFRSLLVLRCLRSDLIINVVEQLVKDQLKLRKEDLVDISVEDAYVESNTEIPITCIFKGIATPVDEIMTCAKRRNMLKRLWVFSLDQSQGPRILEAIKEAAIWGKWVLLQNCHVNIPWMNSELRNALYDAKTRPVHECFRLWLTLMPTLGRQPYLLADSVKVVVEPAKGVKAKIVHIFVKELADEFYHVVQPQTHVQKDTLTHGEHSRGLFRLALFHSLIQERAHFGAMGWNEPMELDHTVFNLAKAELMRLLDDQASTSENWCCLTPVKEANWRKMRERTKEKNKMDCLLYMMVKVVYGAYVIDNWDEHLMYKLFQQCFDSNDTGIRGKSIQTYLPDMKGSTQAFFEHAKQLPEPDDLEVMGLPKDAVLNRAREDTLELFKEALILETSKESFMASRSSIFETKRGIILQYITMIGDSLNTTFPEHDALARSQQIMDPFYLLLLQEARRYNHLIETMKSCIADVLKAIEVSGNSTSEIEAFYGSIVSGMVPRLWLSRGYASLKSLTNWIIDFCDRIDYMQKWFKDGRPQKIWLSFLFCPQALFGAIAQAFARSQKISVSSISLDIEVVDSELMSTKVAEDSCLIIGLYIEGARWDKDAHALTEVQPKHLLSKMCPLRLQPRITSSFCKMSANNDKMYCCPIYTTQARNGLDLMLNYIVAQ